MTACALTMNCLFFEVFMICERNGTSLYHYPSLFEGFPRYLQFNCLENISISDMQEALPGVGISSSKSPQIETLETF